MDDLLFIYMNWGYVNLDWDYQFEFNLFKNLSTSLRIIQIFNEPIVLELILIIYTYIIIFIQMQQQRTLFNLALVINLDFTCYYIGTADD